MNRRQQVVELARKKGILRAADVEGVGISRNYLYRMHGDGLLRRCGGGLYTLPEAPLSEYSSLSEVAKRVPNGVICLISALSYHKITTQIPHEIWLTIPRGAWRPEMAYPPLNLTYISGRAYSFGIEEHVMNGVTVNIYSPAKTIADCFKFRNKVGLDVAIEALREAWRSRKVTIDELVEAAKIDRVSRIIRPYLEAIV